MRKLAVAAALVVGFGLFASPAPALATVTTSTRSVTYSPGSPTTVFAVTFPFQAADHLVVTKTLIASGVGTILTRNVDYSVALPVGSTQGSVTTFASVTSTHTLKIERVTPLTQTTSFITQGSYSAARTENAVDKLTMIAQELRAVAGADGTTAVNTHVAQADPHTQYFLLAGRAGGQHGKGGTASGENLQLSSTAHATKGKVLIGSGGTELVVDDVNNVVGIGTATPSTSHKLDIAGHVRIQSGQELYVGNVFGGDGSGNDLWVRSTSHATKGDIVFGSNGSELVVDDVNNRVGVGTATPAAVFDVNGAAQFRGSPVNLQIDGGVVAANSDSASSVVTIGTYTAAGSPAGGALITTTGPSNSGEPGTVYVDWATNLYLRPGTAAATFNAVKIDQVGQVYGLRRGTMEASIAETLTTANCNSVIFAATDNTVISLPELPGTSTTLGDGCVITVFNAGADGAALVSISPTATDAVVGSCTGITGAGAATIVQSGGVAGKDWRNTKATANQGDYTTLVAYDFGHATAGKWYISGCVGEWASEP